MGAAAASELVVERCHPACVQACPGLAEDSILLQRRKSRHGVIAATGSDDTGGAGGTALHLLSTMGTRIGAKSWFPGVLDEEEQQLGGSAEGGAQGDGFTAAASSPEDDLQQAAVRGDLLKLKKALERGADVAAGNSRGATPVMLASLSNGKDAMAVLTELVDRKADVSAKDKNGWCCLHHACRNGKTEVAKFLISLQMDPALMTTDHKTTLMLAAMEGKLDLVKELVKYEGVRAQAPVKDAFSVSALHCAAKEGSQEIAKLILECGAKANTTDIEGKTPLMWACEHGRIDCAKVIVKRRGNVNFRDRAERTPIWYACSNSHEATALWLLKKFADPNSQDVNGDSPLMLAEEYGLNELKRQTKVNRAQDDAAS
mmetsp:Transcript_40078/g.127567  ORF Transcript_40078/g.127567 Transcript_40078/m.127567 type:complete len:373 (-) Transcript_40078:52-1170(-)